METINELNFYKSFNTIRIKQSESVYNCIKDNFNFNYVECIETGASQNLDDGCFGLYLAKITESKNGLFSSVDIHSDIIEKSNDIFNKYLPNFKINYYVDDSIEFLKKYKGSPNLVHLDSYDLDLTNPIPAMLHCWLEFESIKDKMPSGSIIMIDDNFLKGTWVNWNEIIDGKYTGNFKKIDITYDIIGKGSLIYHWCQRKESDWNIIGNHYNAGDNIKIIIKKL